MQLKLGEIEGIKKQFTIKKYFLPTIFVHAFEKRLITTYNKGRKN